METSRSPARYGDAVAAAEAAAEHATVVGRRVAANMGAVRFGGSGRPVPSVFSGGVRGSGAVVHGRVPHIALEANPTSPFARKLEAETAISLSPRLSNSKSLNAKRGMKAQTRTQRQSSISIHGIGDGRSKNSESRKDAPLTRSHTAADIQADGDLADHIHAVTAPIRDTDAVVLDRQDSKRKKSRIQPVRSADTMRGKSAMLLHSSCQSSSMNLLPDLEVSSSSMDVSAPRNTGPVQRRDPVYPFRYVEGPHRSPGASPRRYHVAFRSPVTPQATATAILHGEHAHTLPGNGEVFPQYSAPSSVSLFSENNVANSLRDVWKSVDVSIGQMYEDPPIEFVADRLFHVKMSSSVPSRKRIRQNQRERVIVAAEELHQAQNQQRAKRDQVWRRKEQIQELSEAIRRRNKKYAKSPRRADISAGATQSKRQVNQGVTDVVERKPPVPRLSGTRHKSAKRKRSTSTQNARVVNDESTEEILAPGLDANADNVSSATVSVSVVIPSARPSDEHENGIIAQDVTQDADVRENNKHMTKKVKMKSLSAKRNSRERKSTDERENSRTKRRAQALDERRAIAREYMMLQQQQRAMHRQKAKKKEQIEREKRRQQLEILEERRLENLRHSRKRPLPSNKPLRRKSRSRMEQLEQKSPTSVSEARKNGYRNDTIIATTPSGLELVDGVDHEDQDQISDVENDAGQSNTSFRSARHQLHTQFPDPEVVRNHIDTIQDTSLNEVVEVPRKVENPTVQRLLNLRQKALELSQRLNSIRQRQTSTAGSPYRDEHRLSSTTASQLQHNDGRDDESGSNGSPEPDDRSEHSTCYKLSLDGEEIEGEIGTEFSPTDWNASVADEDIGEDANWSDSDVSENGGDSSDHDPPTSFTEHTDNYTTISQLQEVTTIMDTSRYDVEASNLEHDGSDIDVRSIGVYSIAVVWPLAQGDSAAAEEPRLRFTELSSNSSDSNADQDLSEDEIIPRRNFDLINDDSDNDLENVRSRSGHAHSEDSQGPPSIGKISNRLRRSVDGGEKQYTAIDRRLSDDQGGFATTAWRMDLRSPPSDAFYRLVKAEDDSLSVIQRTAKQLFERQQERRRLKQENEEQLQIHEALESSFEDVGDKYPPEEVREFARLDEIMREVEREQIAERSELESKDTDQMPPSVERSDKSDSDVLPEQFGINDSLPAKVTSSTEFWDELISDATGKNNHEYEAPPRRLTCHIEMDTSELEMQREDRQRQAECGTDYIESGDGGGLNFLDQHRRRNHSPRTLAQRLLAEVEYHEAINEAHLKLTMMEQAQLLEQAQAETINIATAFKEEMEQNAINHQIALDHATIEKRFDNDLDDVMHQLREIEEVEVQQRTGREEAILNELKQARLRECSVQTDDPRVTDIGTSAPLQVDASTSPVSPGVSIAVQYESISPPKECASVVEQCTDESAEHEAVSAAIKQIAEGEVAEYSEDEFEEESHRISRSIATQNEGIQSERSISVNVKSTASVRAASEVVNEIESVESAASTPKSKATSSEAASEDIDVEDSGVIQATSRSEVDGIVDSATVEYEDDFNASIATGEVPKSLVNSEVDDEFELKSNYEQDAKNLSDQSEAEIESDKLSEQFDAADSAPAVIKSNRSGSIESSVDDDFAESANSVAAPIDDHSANEEYDDDAEIYRSSSNSVSERTKPTTLKLNVTEHLATIDVVSARNEAFTSVTRDDCASISVNPPQQVPLMNLVNDGAVPDQVVQAYMAELERRNQSEVSMLSLRMQAMESHVLTQTQRIDAALADKTLDTIKRADWMMRKQRLQIAFMSEKANIDSLKAAATARYYQDLLAFQSLLSGDTPHVTAVNGPSFAMSGIDMAATAHFQLPQPSIVERTPGALSQFDKSKDSEEYADEFASLTQDHEKSQGQFVIEPSSLIEEEENSAPDDERVTNTSIASEVDDSESQCKEDGMVDNLPSDSHIDSDFEHNTQDNSIAEEDQKEDQPVDEDPALSDQYAASEFEEETQDMLEECAEVEEVQAREINDVLEKAVSESDHASITEDDKSVHNEVKDVEIEKQRHPCDDSDSIVEEGYDDDFASVSASVPDLASDGQHEPNFPDGEVEELEKDFDAVSDDDHSVESNYEDEDAPSEAQSIDLDYGNATDGHEQTDQNNEAGDNSYFDGGVELSESGGRITALDFPEKSVVDSALHSASDESSTTKLLIQEVTTLEGALAVAESMNPEIEFNKIERKKAKVLELLGAKEKLLNQQARAFRIEEEKRLVNEAAHLALGLDISKELQEEKLLVAHELQSEFDAIKQSYPRLKKMERVTADKIVGISNALVLTPAPLIALDDRNALHNESADDEYDAQSFEDARHNETKHEMAIESTIKLNSADKFDTASNVSQRYSDFSDEVDEESNEIEGAGDTDIPDAISETSQVVLQSAIGEKEDQYEVESDNSSPSNPKSAISEAEEYEDEYENESFADAQSVTSIVDENYVSAVGDGIHSEPGSVDEPSGFVASIAASEAASEYGEDDFEAASESDASASSCGGDPEVNTNRINRKESEEPPTQEEHFSASEHELSAALVEVTSKLDELSRDKAETTGDIMPIDEMQQHPFLDRADESTRELPSSTLTPAADSHAEAHSTSASSEEESLTKSIEERMARLERLKALIQERQNDIRQVNRQIRVEMRKEALTTEEKALWKEVEDLEHQLQVDATSLELIRQRNQLELSRLEARQQIQRLPSKVFGNVFIERDFLDGFDFVEVAEPCEITPSLPRDVDVQVSMGVEVECQTTDHGVFQEKVVAVSRPADLLATYAHIEEAELAVVDEFKQVQAKSTEERGYAKMSVEASHELRSGATINQIHEENKDLKDLLEGFCYVETAESVDQKEVDLLAAFDYVEQVETVAKLSEKPHHDAGNNGCYATPSKLELLEHSEDVPRGAVDDIFDQVVEAEEECYNISGVEDGQDGDNVSSFAQDAVNECEPPEEYLKVEQHRKIPEFDKVKGSIDEFDREEVQPEQSMALDDGTIDRMSSLILSDLLDDVGSVVLCLRQCHLSLGDDAKEYKPLVNPDESIPEVRVDQHSEAIDQHSPAPTLEKGRASDSDRVDAVTELIFEALVDQVLLTQIGDVSRKSTAHPVALPHVVDPKETDPPLSTSVEHLPVATDQIERIEVPQTQHDSALGRFVEHVLGALTIKGDQIQLRDLSALESYGLDSDSAQMLYDVVEEIARSALNAHLLSTPSLSTCTVAGGEELLVALRQAVRCQVDALGSVGNEMHEQLDRQLRALTDGDDQIDAEDVALLRQFSSRAPAMAKVSSSAAGAWLATPPVALSSSLVPRTPTPTSGGRSRGRKSLVSLTRSRQQAELQRRVTDAILSDLLADATSRLR